MIAKRTLTLLCLLAPLLAAAGPPDALDVYASLIEKTLLMPLQLPFLSDPIISDLPTEKTNAIARIESEFAKQGIAVIHDGPHFVILLLEKQRPSLTNDLSLLGAEIP